MQDVNYGRALMGDSLGFHIIFAMLSIGFPFLLNVIEYFAWKRDSEPLYKIVRLLTEWTTVLVVVGVVSGTLIAMQFSILWGPFVAASRPYVGKFFMLEGYAFMVEAAFLAWYRVSAGKVSKRKHWLIGLPITIGAMASAACITIVNAWMNNPSKVISSTTFFEITHSISAYLLASLLIVIGWFAWRLWHTKTTQSFPHWMVYKLSVLALGLLVVIAVLGHQSAQNLSKTQPLKLAGIEILDKTGTNAPLRVGGEINKNGKAEGGVVIPSALSVLAGNSPNYKVVGLDSAPRERWPMLIIHTLFDIKMLLVGLISGTIVGTIFIYRRGGKHKIPMWWSRILTVTSVSGILLVELGWMITELGRQPWAIGEVLPTAVANSTLTAGDLIFSMLLICGLYTLFLVAELFLMFKFARLGPSSLKTGRYHYEQSTATTQPAR